MARAYVCRGIYCRNVTYRTVNASTVVRWNVVEQFKVTKVDKSDLGTVSERTKTDRMSDKVGEFRIGAERTDYGVGEEKYTEMLSKAEKDAGRYIKKKKVRMNSEKDNQGRDGM